MRCGVLDVFFKIVIKICLFLGAKMKSQLHFYNASAGKTNGIWACLDNVIEGKKKATLHILQFWNSTGSCV